MSKQCRFYLIPPDIELILDELRTRFGAKLIAPSSDTPQPIELASPFSALPVSNQTSVHCYLTQPSGANIKMRHAPKLNKWLIEDEGAEVIQFSGCRFDGTLLEIGRFYYKTDMLIEDTIWRQRNEFTAWADKVFRAAKRRMRYSDALQAYIGEHAANWRQSGGRFASLIRPGDTPIYADE